MSRGAGPSPHGRRSAALPTGGRATPSRADVADYESPGSLDDPFVASLASAYHSGGSTVARSPGR